MAAVSVVTRVGIVVGCLWLCGNVPRKKAGLSLAAPGPTVQAAQPGCAAAP